MLFRETVGFYFKNHAKDKRHGLGEIEKLLTLHLGVKLGSKRLKLHLVFIPV